MTAAQNGGPRRASEARRAFSEDGALKTHVGGQALIEGVMMRGKYNWSVAVREPDGGIYREEHDLASGRKKNGWLYWPVVRGCRAFVESLVLGYKALEIAALHAYGVEGSGTAGSPDDSEAAAASDAATPGTAGRPDASGAAPAAAAGPADVSAQARRAFSWKDDFGNPDEAIDALGAQRSLAVVSAPASDAAAVAGDAAPDAAAAPCAAGSACGPAASACDGEAAPVSHASASASPADADAGFGKKEMAVSMALGLVLGVALFIVAPALIANLIVGEYDGNTLAWNIVDGIVRVAVFVFYIWLIGRMGEIRRMFGYHGAEHKAIHCFEHGLPLTPDNARSFPRLHVRCGTAFLIMVMIIAILVYTVTPLNALIAAWGVPDGPAKLVLVIAVRILLMPVIAGVSYEITVKWAGSHPDNPLVKVILWPGMQMQRLTTREPDDGQIECAIEAMKMVLAREDREAAQARV